MKMPCTKFSSADEIRAFRKKIGLPQHQFWPRVGVTQSSGSRYESGGRAIPGTLRMLLTITYGTPSESERMTVALRAWKE